MTALDQNRLSKIAHEVMLQRGLQPDFSGEALEQLRSIPAAATGSPPEVRDLRNLPTDVANHIRLRFHHTQDYNVLQKLAYASVLFVALPLMIATGLTMSPGFDSVAPWLLDLFGGRQTARSLHFLIMVALVAFFIVHMVMILAAGPINEIRSIITGWYRTDAEGGENDNAA